MTTGAFENAQEPKDLFWIDGATHVGLYDRAENVTPAVAKMTDFFQHNLTGAPEPATVA
jgi:fermentation-respiration switch protein FrsA (DUF1100 family)